LCFFIAVTLLMQMGMYVLHLLFGWNLSFNLILLCNKVAHFFGLFFIEYMLSAVIFHTMFVLFIKAVKQVIQMRKVRKMITKLRNETTTAH
ncbi:M56 family peptidase, partial [Bacillus subtilis]